MDRLWGSWIVAPLVALPTLGVAARDDIRNNPFWADPADPEVRKTWLTIAYTWP